jgi:predicted component of type VI protein secretion system
MASVTVIFGGKDQKTYELDKPRLEVGREPGCEIHIDNLGISRKHCAFVNRNDTFVVQDLGSSNGTYVNGNKITEYYLNDGDEVIIGKYSLKFHNQAQAAVAVQAASAPEVPDSPNTYIMDGEKIRAQLAQMRGGQPGAAPLPPAGATAAEYAKALDQAKPSGAAASEIAKLKTLVVALIAVVAVLLLVIVLMFLGVIRPTP